MRRAELVVLCLGSLLLLLCCNAVPFGHYADDVVWALLARSLLHASLSAAWSFVPRLETTTTWGFSLLLLPAAAFGSLALKLWSAALLIAGTLLFFAAVRELLPEKARPALAAALFFNGFYASFSGNVISEAGYLFVFGGGCLLLLKKDWLPRFPGRLGLLAGFLVLTRAVGAAWAAAAAHSLIRGRRWRGLAWFLAGACVALPYFVASKLATGAYTYHGGAWALWRAQGPAAGLRVLGSNAWFYLKGLSLLSLVYFPAFMPNVAWLKVLATAAMTAVAVLGAARVARDDRTGVLVPYVLVYASVIAAWPYQAPRFAAPLFPLFALFFVAGLCAPAGRRVREVSLALVCAVVFSNLGELRGALKASLGGPVDVPGDSYRWLAEHTSPGEPIVSMDIARISYYAGRRGVHFIASDSPESFVAGARRLGARRFFLNEPSYVPASPGVRDPLREQYDRLKEYLGHREWFTPVYRNPHEGATVYELDGGIRATGSGTPSRP